MVLLLLPVLYVVSYFALVVPEGHMVIGRVTSQGAYASREHYRFGAHRIKSVFWPLEQIDRRVRPLTWLKVGLEKQIDDLRVLSPKR